jgi:hypothetical protein
VAPSVVSSKSDVAEIQASIVASRRIANNWGGLDVTDGNQLNRPTNSPTSSLFLPSLIPSSSAPHPFFHRFPRLPISLPLPPAIAQSFRHTPNNRIANLEPSPRFLYLSACGNDSSFLVAVSKPPSSSFSAPATLHRHQQSIIASSCYG